MSIAEKQALDMSALLSCAFELSDLVKRSAEMADYLYWKKVKEEDPAVREAVKHLERKKELLEECRRFGHFHPDYHAALEEAKRAQEALDQIESVREFKRAEDALDDLLYTISKMIAHAVSDSIKVPGNRMPETGGCCSGGACKCG